MGQKTLFTEHDIVAQSDGENCLTSTQLGVEKLRFDPTALASSPRESAPGNSVLFSQKMGFPHSPYSSQDHRLSWPCLSCTRG